MRQALARPGERAAIEECLPLRPHEQARPIFVVDRVGIDDEQPQAEARGDRGGERAPAAAGRSPDDDAGAAGRGEDLLDARRRLVDRPARQGLGRGRMWTGHADQRLVEMMAAQHPGADQRIAEEGRRFAGGDRLLGHELPAAQGRIGIEHGRWPVVEELGRQLLGHVAAGRDVLQIGEHAGERGIEACREAGLEQIDLGACQGEQARELAEPVRPVGLHRRLDPGQRLDGLPRCREAETERGFRFRRVPAFERGIDLRMSDHALGFPIGLAPPQGPQPEDAKLRAQPDPQRQPLDGVGRNPAPSSQPGLPMPCRAAAGLRAARRSWRDHPLRRALAAGDDHAHRDDRARRAYRRAGGQGSRSGSARRIRRD